MNNINEIIIKTISAHNIKKHSDFIRMLKDQHGITINQSTLSRKLSSLNVKKLGGYYALEVTKIIGRTNLEFTYSVPNMIVIKTPPGHASAIALKIDQISQGDRFLSNVIKGTIAGDDTIFIATDGESNLDDISKYLKDRI